MSNAILNLIAKEQAKAQRRRANAEATKMEIEIFGETEALQNRLARQELAIKESVDRLEKLNKTLKK